MVNSLFHKGRQGFLEGSIDYDTDTINTILLDLNTADTGIKTITGATNATPIVVTATSHGFSNGDTVYINGIVGNEAANGLWTIANVATNTFELTTPAGVNASGSGAYSSGGYAVCLGPSASGDNLDDFDGAIVGSAVTLANKTVTNGVADADDPTFLTVTGNSVEALAVYKHTGTASTSKMIALITGRHIVTAAVTASSSATTIYVEPLVAAIPNSTSIYFSNGQVATLSAAANAGDRSLTVTALGGSVTAGSRALAPATGSGLPVTPNGGSITFAIDNGVNKLFKL